MVVFPGTGNLIDLLEVLPGIIIVRSLGREGIISHPLQILGPLEIARHAEHPLQGVHHFHGRAKLGAPGWIPEMEVLVAGPEPGREADGMADGAVGLLRGFQVFLLAGTLPPDDGLFEALCQIDAMDGILGGQLRSIGKHPGKVDGLAMDKVADFQEEGLPGDIV